MILDRLKSGLPLDHLKVIDVHGHFGIWQLSHMPFCSVEDTIETMDRVGIRQLWLSSLQGCFSGDFRCGNDALAAAVARYPDRLVGQIVVNPNCPDQIVPELERCRQEHGMPLVKIHPFCHEYPVDGPGYQSLWSYAQEHGLVVLSHTWESDKNCGPGMFVKIARNHPKVKIILAHAGGTQKGCQEAMAAAKECENLYIDTATSHVHITMIERFVQTLGADRVLFGSDIPLIDPAVPLGRVAFAKIREEDKEKILSLNAARLLGA